MEEVPLREAIGERGREFPWERSAEYVSSAICCNSNAAATATKQLHDRQKMPIFHEDKTSLAAPTNDGTHSLITPRVPQPRADFAVRDSLLKCIDCCLSNQLHAIDDVKHTAAALI